VRRQRTPAEEAADVAFEDARDAERDDPWPEPPELDEPDDTEPPVPEDCDPHDIADAELRRRRERAMGWLA
jgi:hypothetical protein